MNFNRIKKIVFLSCLSVEVENIIVLVSTGTMKTIMISILASKTVMLCILVYQKF